VRPPPPDTPLRLPPDDGRDADEVEPEGGLRGFARRTPPLVPPRAGDGLAIVRERSVGGAPPPGRVVGTAGRRV
tara:strand:+ start:9021 stop:9242 length:222 start_codon:yes stop_codon:yes gene_type:complete